MKILSAHFRVALSAALFSLCVALLITGCQKEKSIEHPDSLARPSKGSLQDELGDCFPSSVHGRWYNGVTPSSDTNYVEVTVNVAQTGYYRIATDVRNGVMLADSGLFSSTGMNTVRLKAIGSFLNHVTTDFTMTYDTTACQFSINVEDSTGTGLGPNPGGGNPGNGNPGTGTGGANLADNTWQFTANGHVYSGTAQATTAQMPAIPQIGQAAYTAFSFIGQVPNSIDTLFTFTIKLAGTTPAAGTYKTSSIPNQWYFMKADFTTNTPIPIFQADPTVTSKVINITITSYDAATKTVVGTFDGTARNASGASVTISSSGFKGILQ